MIKFIDNLVFIYVLVMLGAIAFGVNFMGYEQYQANKGIFISPAMISAPDPTEHHNPTIPLPKSF